MAIPPDELAGVRIDARAGLAPTDRVKERLRQMMLRESWACAIDYMAEIKSDRELAEDPILTCLPGHLRWTIHAKAGQLALSTPIAAGIRVQAWAGAAVFKLTRRKDVKLCTLPVLALEGASAIPVRVRGVDDALALAKPASLLHLPGRHVRRHGRLPRRRPEVTRTQEDELACRTARARGRSSSSTTGAPASGI
ncbi:hypothetical protein ACFSTC_10220 [Nonomuraea ferruginea]